MLRGAVIFVILSVFCFEAEALDNGLARTPPMGWLTWERFRCNTDCKNYPDSCIGEKLLRNMAEKMVSEGYAAVGYEYVIIDDCWMTHERAANGSLVADPDRFPNGIKNLAAYIHSLGLKFGIYEDLGTSTCGGYPGSLEYLEIDANTFASWDVDYVKFDGCNSDSANFDVKYPEFGRYLNLTGRPMVYSCEWPLYQNRGEKSNYTAIAATCNLWRSYNDIDDSYDSMSDVLKWHGDNQDKINVGAGPGAWNDPDMIIIGNFGLSVEQSKAQMTGWAMIPAPLIMSNDLRAMDEKMKGILLNKDVIAVNQDKQGAPGKRISNDDGIQIWTRVLAPTSGNQPSYAVAFISTRTDGTLRRVDFDVAKLNSNSSKFAVKELYGSVADMEISRNDTLTAQVPPTGALLFRFDPK